MRREAEARCGTASANLATATATLDLLMSSMEAHPQQVRSAGLDVAAARVVLRAPPPAVSVDPSYAVTLAERIQALAEGVKVRIAVVRTPGVHGLRAA